MRFRTMNRVKELERAVEALVEIANGHANNGVPYYAAQLRTMAQDALEDMHQIQMVESSRIEDSGGW